MSGLRELPGYSHAPHHGAKPWEEGDAEAFLERVRAAGQQVGPAGGERRMRWNLRFGGTVASFCEVLMVVSARRLRNLAVRVEREYPQPDGKRYEFGVGFDATFGEWEAVGLAVKSIPLEGLDVKQYEIHAGE